MPQATSKSRNNDIVGHAQSKFHKTDIKSRNFGDDISSISNIQSSGDVFKSGGMAKSKPRIVNRSPKISSDGCLFGLDSSDSLQLLAFTSLMIALKAEGSLYYRTNDLQQLLNTKYTSEQLWKCEHLILECLGWNINLPSCSEIVKYLLVGYIPEFDFSALLAKAQEFTDLCLLDNEFLKYGIV